VRKVLAKRPLRWLPGLASFLVLWSRSPTSLRARTCRSCAAISVTPRRFSSRRCSGLAHLRVDPARLYSEDTLFWVIWYAGIATVLLAAFGAAVLISRCLRSLFNLAGRLGCAAELGPADSDHLRRLGGRAVAAVHGARSAVGQQAARAGRDPWHGPARDLGPPPGSLAEPGSAAPDR